MAANIVCTACGREVPFEVTLQILVHKFDLKLSDETVTEHDDYGHTFVAPTNVYDVPIRLIRALCCTKCGKKSATVEVVDDQVGVFGGPWISELKVDDDETPELTGGLHF